jgi:transposase InsO family protein
VERAQRTHTQSAAGGYELYNGDLAIQALNQALRAWERAYNTVRPQQALDYLTPH